MSSVNVNVPLDHHHAALILSLLDKLHAMAAERRWADARRLNRPLPSPLPLVQCKPWCEKGDGHPDAIGKSDQACWSPCEYVDCSLESSPQGGFPQRIGVYTEHEPGTDGNVRVHLDGIVLPGPIPTPYDVLDHGLGLTPEEARRLGEALMREAARLEVL